LSDATDVSASCQDHESDGNTDRQGSPRNADYVGKQNRGQSDKQGDYENGSEQRLEFMETSSFNPASVHPEPPRGSKVDGESHGSKPCD
jgi:hypothetical protein